MIAEKNVQIPQKSSEKNHDMRWEGPSVTLQFQKAQESGGTGLGSQL